MSVSRTTSLTGWLAAGTLIGFIIAARLLSQGFNTYRLASCGALIGLAAFPCVILSAPVGSVALFQAGAAMIGLGSGLFSVSMLTAAMAIGGNANVGIALGAWGAVQATSAGAAIAASGATKDVVAHAGANGTLGPAFLDPSASYTIVYHIEIVLLFATLAALGPLTARLRDKGRNTASRFELAEFPG